MSTVVPELSLKAWLEMFRPHKIEFFHLVAVHENIIDRISMESNDSKQGMQSQSATLCKAGCGFYGSSSSDGYCSVCFKQKLQRRLLLSEGVSAAAPAAPAPCDPPSSDNDSPDQGEGNESEPAVQIARAESSDDGDASADSAPQTGEDASAAASTPDSDEPLPPPSKSGEVTLEGTSQEPLDLRKKSPEAADEDELKDKVEEGEGSKKKNRCLICKKKVGLTGFGCRCGGLFCSLHRYSDTHGCNFDYKEQGQLEIRKNNPKVTFQKVAKI